MKVTELQPDKRYVLENKGLSRTVGFSPGSPKRVFLSEAKVILMFILVSFGNGYIYRFKILTGIQAGDYIDLNKTVVTQMTEEA